MTHLFDKRDLWGNRFSLWVVVAMAFVAPLSCWSLQQTRLDHDAGKWLPDNDAEIAAQRWVDQQFSVDERILLTWEGSSLNDPRVGKLVEQLTGKSDEHGVKRGGLPYVASVVNPLQTLDVLQRNGIEPHEAVRRLEGTILGAGPLRIRLTEASRSALRKTKRELQIALLRQRGVDAVVTDASPDLTSLVAIPASQVEGEAAKEPSSPAILSVEGQLVENQSTEHDLQVSWNGMRIGSESTMAIVKWLSGYVPERGDGKPLVETAFFALGSPVALAIGISEAGMADQAETVAAIKLACDQVGIPSGSLHLAGKVVANTELNHQLSKAAWDPAFPLIQIHRRSVVLTSMLISSLLTFVLLRSIWLAAATGIVSAFAMFCSMALVNLTGGSVNMLLIVLPTLSVLMTVSGAMHLINYWRHSSGVDASQAIGAAVRRSWMPSLFASVAVAGGLISLATSPLAPVRSFGIYAAAGTIFCASMILFGLPSLMQLWSVKSSKKPDHDQVGWQMIGKMLAVHPGWQALAVIAICVGCGIGLSKFQIETKRIHEFPSRSRIAQDYWFLENNLTGITPIETIIRFDQQSQKDTNFFERIEIVREIQEKMRTHAEISGTISLVDFQPVSERLAEGAGFLQRTKFNKLASAMQQRVRDGELPVAKSFYSVSQVGHDLEQPGDGKLNEPGDELWRITAQVSLMADSDFTTLLSDLRRITQDVLRLHPGAHHLIAGAMSQQVRTQELLRESLIGSFSLASFLVMVVLAVGLRSFVAGLVTMIPTIAPVAVVFGVASWIGQRIDIGTMITASIGLGLSVEGMLHYLTWVRLAMKDGKTRQEAIVDALVHCGPAAWQTRIMMGMGFLALTAAEFPPIARFGWMMTSMTGVALLSNLVLLPQILGSPLGWIFESAKSKQETAVLAEQPAPAIEEAIPPTAQEASVPAPHIDTTVKKRRSPPRRGMDAG